jgi:hypothetical protein
MYTQRETLYNTPNEAALLGRTCDIGIFFVEAVFGSAL